MNIENQVKTALSELCELSKIQAGDIVVIGCSTSEVDGGVIGHNSNVDLGSVIFNAANQVLLERGAFLAAQCCEHLNRAIIIERDAVKNINDIVNDFETETFDVITCNPPYFENHGLNRKNDNEIKSVARHEIHMQLEDIFKISKKLLKNSGVVAIVHRPERLVEIIETMKKYNIEPKRLQFIYPNESKESNMILIEGKKNGNKGLKILKPLFVHEDNGNYRKEILDMFK